MPGYGVPPENQREQPGLTSVRYTAEILGVIQHLQNTFGDLHLDFWFLQGNEGLPSP